MAVRGEGAPLPFDTARRLVTSGSYAHVLDTLIDKHRPQIVIYGATAMGRDLAPRVASKMRAGLTADCTDLEISDVTDPKTKTPHDNLLLQIRPAFGGNIIATIVNYDRWPQVATVREGVMPMGEADAFRLIKRELRDFIRTEREWAEFFYPKQRAQEHSADPQGPPIIQVLQFGQTDDPGSA